MGDAVAQEKRRILVVDDIELNRVLTEAVLRAATYEVDSVADGTAALRLLADERYDLVLMDVEMPGLDGHDTAEAIRRTTISRVDGGPTRLAAISSQGDAATRRRSTEVGMAAHITRPIAPHRLLQEIERVFCQPAAGDDQRPPCWQRSMYEDWASRLGAERMLGFLSKLQAQLRELLLLVLSRGEAAPLHRRAHDVASTAGMLGFVEVTRCCRAVLEAGDETIEDTACETLADELERAIACLDRHLAANPPAAAMA